MSHNPRRHSRKRQAPGQAGEQAAHLYNEGVTLQAQGKTSLAESAFRRALSMHPEFSEAHNNLGNVLLEQKKWKAAEKSFRRALELIPDNAMLLGNIGKALHLQGKTEAALAELHKAIDLDPRCAPALNQLGAVLMELGRTDEALEPFKQAHVLLPESPEIATRLGGALHELERYEEAVDILHDTVKAHPRYFDAYPRLADAAFKIGAIDDAVKVLQEAARLKPEDESIAARLAEVHYSCRDFLAARTAISRAIRINPKTADYYHRLGRILYKLNLFDDAAVSLGKAIDLEQSNASHHYRLGQTLLECGNRDDAEKSLRQAIKLQPGNVYPYQTLARVRQPLEPGDIKAMQALLQDPGLSEKERATLCFGLGIHFDAAGDYKTAYAYIAEGNALQASHTTRKVAVIEGDRNLKTAVTSDLIKKHGKSGYREYAPIIITGLSRSGKTTLETLLARHSLVTAGGESSDFIESIDQVLTSKEKDTFPECLKSVTASTITTIGKEYAARKQKRFPNGTFVTNTSPASTKHIGTIRLCLPCAKIIVCQRDAKDNCTAIFNKNLGPGHDYSSDMQALGAYYLHQRGLIEYWRNLLPGFIHVVQLEELLRDPQTQINAVLDFCDLPREEACLDTASLPTADAVTGIWKHYREPLKPLFEILESR